MKVLITGGAGYIGSHSVREFLRAGYSNITVVDDLSNGLRENVPKEVNFVEGDFGKKSVLKKVFKKKYDAIVHFAASKLAPESIEKPEKYYDNNVAKSITLLNYAIKTKVKYFIFSSSAAVYGDVKEHPITERSETKPTNPYGWSKLMFEQVLTDSLAVNDFSYVSLRYFNAGGADYGGEIGNNHEKGEDVISVLMRAAKNKSDFTIFGSDYETKDGTCIRDIIHVSDLAKAHVLALEYLEKGGASEIFNLGSENGFSVREITEETKRITGSNFKILSGQRRPGDIVTSIASSQKAKNTLDWRAEHSDLSTIIKTAWDWEKNPSNH